MFPLNKIKSKYNFNLLILVISVSTIACRQQSESRNLKEKWTDKLIEIDNLMYLDIEYLSKRTDSLNKRLNYLKANPAAKPTDALVSAETRLVAIYSIYNTNIKIYPLLRSDYDKMLMLEEENKISPEELMRNVYKSDSLVKTLQKINISIGQIEHEYNRQSQILNSVVDKYLF